MAGARRFAQSDDSSARDDPADRAGAERWRRDCAEAANALAQMAHTRAVAEVQKLYLTRAATTRASIPGSRGEIAPPGRLPYDTAAQVPNGSGAADGLPRRTR